MRRGRGLVVMPTRRAGERPRSNTIGANAAGARHAVLRTTAIVLAAGLLVPACAGDGTPTAGSGPSEVTGPVTPPADSTAPSRMTPGTDRVPDGATSDTSAGEDDPVATGANGATDGAPTDAAATPSPLDELFGWTTGSPTEMRRNALLVEQLTSDCMRREGWEYRPVDYLTRGASTQDPDIALQVSDPDEFGRLHGYGVVYNYEQFEEPTLLGETEPSVDGDAVADPNADYVASLTADELDEYQRSLYGTVLADAMQTGSVPDGGLPMIGNDGCIGEAYDEVYGLNPAASEPDVQARVDQYEAELANLPELQAAYADWRECMGDAADVVDALGRHVDRPDQMWGYVDGLKNDALGLTPVAISRDDVANASRQYVDTWIGADGSGIGWTGTPEPVDADTLDRLRATELDLWQQDHACQVEADVAAITAEVEQRFVDELVEEFPQLVDG